MEDQSTQDGQRKILEELRLIREQLGRLEGRVDTISGKGLFTEGRLKTNVAGLDEALDGGIPSGHVVLLAGPSGTMKTSLALYIMMKNRENGGKGIYVTLEESRESLLKTMDRLKLGGDEDFIVDIGKLRMEHESAEESKDWLQILKDYFERRLEKDRLDVVVVDSLNSLYSLAGIANPRKELFHFFAFLRSIGVTSILVAETEMGGRLFENHEEFLADGAITLDYIPGGSQDPGIRLHCLKMRHANISRASYRLVFSSGRFSISAITSE